MQFKPRKYRYKGTNPDSEQKRFWIMIIIGIAVSAAIMFFF